MLDLSSDNNSALKTQTSISIFLSGESLLSDINSFWAWQICSQDTFFLKSIISYTQVQISFLQKFNPAIGQDLFYNMSQAVFLREITFFSNTS